MTFPVVFKSYIRVIKRKGGTKREHLQGNEMVNGDQVLERADRRNFAVFFFKSGFKKHFTIAKQT